LPESSIVFTSRGTGFHLPGTLFLRVLVQRRNLIGQLVRRDFEQRFVGSIAGWVWTLIHPLVMLLIWVFVFQTVLHVPTPAWAAHKNFAVYLLCGYLPWLLFSEAVVRSAGCLVDHATLLTKTVFPSEVLPVTVFLSSLISNALTVLIAVAAVLITEHRQPWTLVFLPLLVFIVALLSIGVSWIAASLQVYLRDTAQFVQVLLNVWFWCTPILLDDANFPPWARAAVHWNPLTAVVRAYRQCLLIGQLPNWRDLALSAALSAAVFVIGGLFFRRLKRGFADVL
jgi:ABC-type polysaccharide/polyol phosphate export permease